ncbi:hypothetical protein VroAM7_50080 (plasmid) [Vibrio rotiferianus]|uniref:Porin domain-containing protein n=1 Tax=Vibrio rotiferianus TaxID=190895 RepID=A0A510IEY9_9VIBR|nr:porin [Vibrio rotiferianus]BBL92355.1 hypothetical protein VroAM7_50080 [Vibrio rotiferianus]
MDKWKYLAVLLLIAFNSKADIELYSDETKSVSMMGEVDVFADLFNKHTSELPELNKDEDFEVSLEAFVEFQYTHQLTDGLNTFAAFEIYSYEDRDNERQTEFDDIYVGLEGKYGTLFIGEAEDSVDVVGILTDISNDGVYALDSLYEEEGKGIRYEYIYSDTYLVSADMQSSGEDNVDKEYSIAASYQTDNVNLSAMYTEAGERMGLDLNAYAIGVGLRNETYYFAALFSSYEGPYSQGNGYFNSGKLWSAAASYTWNAFRVYATSVFDSDDQSDNSAIAYTTGVDYLVNEDMLIFGEYTGSEHDMDNWKTSAAVLGLFYKF